MSGVAVESDNFLIGLTMQKIDFGTLTQLAQTSASVGSPCSCNQTSLAAYDKLFAPDAGIL